jgi:hypothetical protein
MMGPEREPDKRAMPLSLDERRLLAAIETGLTEDHTFAGAFALLCNPSMSSPESATSRKQDRVWGVALTVIGMMLAVLGTALLSVAIVLGIALMLMGCGSLIWGIVRYLSRSIDE